MLRHQFSAALTFIKNKASSSSFESQLCHLKCCNVSIGNMNFSRKNIPDIMGCMCVVIDEATETYLKTNLKSTGMRPHCFITVNKSTQHRETSQIVMLSYFVDGIRQAYPVDLSPVYVSADGTGGTASELGNLAIKSIIAKLHFDEEDFSYMQERVTDGQYLKGKDFNTSLSQYMPEINNNISINNDYFMPLLWDSAHWVDLIFNKIRKSEAVGKFVSTFIERVSDINLKFHTGKMHSLAEGTAKDIHRPFRKINSIASHSFLSSNFKQIGNILITLPNSIETYRDHEKKR